MKKLIVYDQENLAKMLKTFLDDSLFLSTNIHKRNIYSKDEKNDGISMASNSESLNLKN